MNLNLSIFFLNIMGVALILLAVATIHAKNLINSVIMSGLFSLLATISYAQLKAPDVAITEVAVGSAIASILFIITLTCIQKEHKLPEATQYEKLKNTIWVAIFSLSALAVATMFPQFGLDNCGNLIMAEFYIQNTIKDFKIANIVTAILGGYRGFDTLFETTVIFTAAMGVRHIAIQENM